MNRVDTRIAEASCTTELCSSTEEGCIEIMSQMVPSWYPRLNRGVLTKSAFTWPPKIARKINHLTSIVNNIDQFNALHETSTEFSDTMVFITLCCASNNHLFKDCNAIAKLKKGK